MAQIEVAHDRAQVLAARGQHAERLGHAARLDDVEAALELARQRSPYQSIIVDNEHRPPAHLRNVRYFGGLY